MEESELVKIIENHVNQGIGSESGELSTTRQTLLDRYMGELYGNELEGQSKIVTREVMETVEWAMPAVMRVFAGAGKVVEFEPEGPEDERAAEQETDAVNYIYNKHNNGFVVTHTIVKSALLNPNSYVKVYRDESEEVATENYENMSDEGLAGIYSDSELEVMAADVNELGLYDLEVKRTSARGKNKVEALPEDECVIDSNWPHLSLDGCPFTCHKPEKTHSELRLMGYSEKDLDDAYTAYSETSEATNRDRYADEGNDDNDHKALRKYTYYECNMLVDWDDDGIAERRHVVMVGKKILENEETDEQPMESAASILMPHRHVGLSYAQTIKDLQDVMTTVMRQLMTNMYKANNPRTIALKGANMADLLANRANGIIRAKAVGDVTTEPVAPIIGQVIPLLDLLNQQKEMRSGVTRNGMGLDADILAKSTEGAFMGALEKADQRIEMLVRTLAETIFKSIFLKLHALMIKHGDNKFIKTSGQWVEINPSEWRKRESMTAKVGTGHSDTKQKMMAANMIILDQDKLLAGGLGGTLVSPQNLYNSRKLLVQAAGEVNPDKYYLNPSMAPPKQPEPPAPDPNLLLIQSNQQIETDKRRIDHMKLQQQGQIEAAKLQFQQAEAYREHQFNQFQLQARTEIEGLKSQITKSKNEDEVTIKMLQTQVDQMEVRLEDAAKDEKLEMDKYRADLESSTRIQLKEMDQDDKAAPVIEENQSMINQTMGHLAQMIAEMTQPREIVYVDGSPVGVKNVGTGEVKTIRKNDDGMPIGVE